MKTTFTLTQGNEFSHTIAVELNPSFTCTFGQLVGQIVFKFFRSAILIRKCGNKGFSFNKSFDFVLEIEGNRLCDTIANPMHKDMEVTEEIKSKARMSNTKEGQQRFVKLLCAMLYASLDDTYKLSMANFNHAYDVHYTAENSESEIRQFLDLQVVELID